MTPRTVTSAFRPERNPTVQAVLADLHDRTLLVVEFHDLPPSMGGPYVEASVWATPDGDGSVLETFKVGIPTLTDIEAVRLAAALGIRCCGVTSGVLLKHTIAAALGVEEVGP